jgi:phthalate 3,4-dioxygenase ferredoxin reductase subunit
MSPVNRVTVIVGSSIAGVRTAQELRTAGYDGDIVLVGEEYTLPYDKPPLSKALLAGATSREAITLLSAQDAREFGIQLMLGRAACRLDVARGYVELADGERLRYDYVVLASGARARPSLWGNPPGVHELRTLDDAIALREDLRRGGPLVVIGAGFIGAEVAATARDMGIDEVTLVDPELVPMSRAISGAAAERIGAMHRQQGVSTLFGTGVTGIDRGAGGLAVRLSDGSRLRAATVVVGIGAIPNDDWLASSGLRAGVGVICDQYSRALDTQRVYAAGDVARWFHRGHGALTRAEHWTNAVEQAACVAHNITHPEDPRPYEPVAYVWSDQYGRKLQLTGQTGTGLRHVTVEKPGSASAFAVLYEATGGVLAGALSVSWPRAAIICRRAIMARTPVDEVCGVITNGDRKVSCASG